MYYCLECTNKLLVHEPLEEDEVETKIFYCKNCKRTLPCVIRFKGYSVRKLSNAAFEDFLKLCGVELLDRWNEPDFQEEKKIFIEAFMRMK